MCDVRVHNRHLFSLPSGQDWRHSSQLDDTDNTKISCQAVFILLCRHADPTKTETIHCTLFSGINKHRIGDKIHSYTYIYAFIYSFRIWHFQPTNGNNCQQNIEKLQNAEPQPQSQTSSKLRKKLWQTESWKVIDVRTDCCRECNIYSWFILCGLVKFIDKYCLYFCLCTGQRTT